MWLHVDISIYIDDSHFIYFNMYYTVLDRWLVGVELFEGRMDPETSRDVLIPASKMVLSPCAARVFIARMKLGVQALQAKGGNREFGGFC